MAEIQLPDGNIAKIPDFALESTQRKMQDLISALVKSNTKAQAALDAINKNAIASLDNNDDIAAAALREQQAQTKLLREQISDKQSFASIFSGRIESDMTKMFVGTGNVLTGLTKGAVLASAALGGFLVKSFMDAGNSLRELTTVGLGTTGAFEGKLVDSISSFTQLGLSTEKAAQTLGRFSANATILGRTNFSRFVTGMAQSASLSRELGLTYQESIDIIGEEIDLRRLSSSQRLNLDLAERTAIEERIRQTFVLSQVTGKSIREISQSSREFFQNNSRVAGLLASLPAEASKQVRSSIDFGVRVGAAVGDQFGDVMNMVFNAASAPITQATDEFRAISGLGVGAQLLTRQMLELHQSMASGTLTEEQARQQSIRFAEGLQQLSEREITQLRLLSEQSGASSEFAKQLLLSAQQVRIGGRNLIDRMMAETAQIDDTIQAVTDVQNAFSRFTGIFSTIFFRSIVGLTGPLDAFAKAINENNGVLDKLSQGVNRIFNAVMNVFGVDIAAAGDQAVAMAAALDKLGVWIENTSTAIAEWIGKFENTNVGDVLIDTLSDGLAFMFSKGVQVLWEATQKIITNYWKEVMLLLGGLVAASLAKSAVVGGATWAAGKMFGGAARTATTVATTAGGAAAAAAGTAAGRSASALGAGVGGLGKGIGDGVGGLGKGLGSGIGGLGSGIGGLGKGLGEFVSSLGKGLGIGIEGLASGIGKGLGSGIGGFLSGIGNALAALGPKSPLIVAGSGAIGVAIGLIGAGIAGATWLLGKAMPTFAEGLKSFEQLDGQKLQNAGLGMGAISLGLAAFAGGSVIAGMGTLIGSVLEGIAKLFGAEDPMDKLVKFSNLDVDPESVKKNATALAVFSQAIAVAGTATSGMEGLIGSITDGLSGLLGGGNPMDKLVKFSGLEIDPERVRKNAIAVTAFSQTILAAGVSTSGLSRTIGSITDGLSGLFRGDPMDKLVRFSEEYDIDVDRVRKNTTAVTAFSQTILAAGVSSGLSRTIGSITDGLTGLFSREQPIDKLVKFSGLEIDPERVRKNATALTAFSQTILVAPISGLSRTIGSITDGLTGLFSREQPIDKLVRFSEYDIDVDRVRKNATALTAFSQTILAAVVSTSGLSRTIGSITDGLSGLFRGENLMDNIQTFANYSIDLVRVRNNSNALVEFSNSMVKIKNSTGEIRSNASTNLIRFVNTAQNLKTDGLTLLTQVMNEFSAAAETFINRTSSITSAGDKVSEVVNRMSALRYLPLRQLGDAMLVLAKGLKEFASVTSQNLFEQFLSAFSTNTTAKFVDNLNMFANNVDSERLMRTAQAVISMNAARSGETGRPTVAPIPQVSVDRVEQTELVSSPVANLQDAALMRMIDNTNSTLTQLNSQLVTMNSYLRNLRELPAIRNNTM
jgi:DNA-binding CsgD family transcriptional regulator